MWLFLSVNAGVKVPNGYINDTVNIPDECKPICFNLCSTYHETVTSLYGDR